MRCDRDTHGVYLSLENIELSFESIESSLESIEPSFESIEPSCELFHLMEDLFLKVLHFMEYRLEEFLLCGSHRK